MSRALTDADPISDGPAGGGPHMHSLSIDFHGALLHVETACREWRDFMRQGYPWFALPQPRDEGFRLAIDIEPHPRMPEALPRTWSGTLPEGGEGRIFETQDTWALEVVGHGLAIIDHARGSGRIVARPHSLERMRFTPLTAVLEAALAARGHRLVHGACLRRRNGGGAVLICAPSGSGKTTTALSLAHGGFAYMADDASVGVQIAERWHVWGLPNELKIHRNTAALLPWLGDLPDKWNRDGEQSVHIDRLAGVIASEPLPPLPLEAVIMLGPRSAGAHRVSRLARADALVAIARDNVSNSPLGVRPWNQEQFSFFADIVRKAPTLQLQVGEDIESLADALEAALKTHLP